MGCCDEALVLLKMLDDCKMEVLKALDCLIKIDSCNRAK